MTNKLLKSLHQHGQIWPATQTKKPYQTVDSGYPLLNKHLLGGFPQEGVVEIQSLSGIGELRLLIPYLQNLLALDAQNMNANRQIVFIAPPAQVNALMLAQTYLPLENVLVISSENTKEALWATEQCLKSGCCLAVLLWQHTFANHQIKRLKQAAVSGGALQIIFRGAECGQASLPVSLTLALKPFICGIEVHIKKQLGGWPCEPFQLDMSHEWPSLTQAPRVNNVVPLSVAKVS